MLTKNNHFIEEKIGAIHKPRWQIFLYFWQTFPLWKLVIDILEICMTPPRSHPVSPIFWNPHPALPTHPLGNWIFVFWLKRPFDMLFVLEKVWNDQIQIFYLKNSIFEIKEFT